MIRWPSADCSRAAPPSRSTIAVPSRGVRTCSRSRTAKRSETAELNTEVDPFPGQPAFTGSSLSPQVGQHGEHAAIVLGRRFDPELCEGGPDVRLDRLRAEPECATDALVR